MKSQQASIPRKRQIFLPASARTDVTSGDLSARGSYAIAAGTTNPIESQPWLKKDYGRSLQLAGFYAGDPRGCVFSFRDVWKRTHGTSTIFHIDEYPDADEPIDSPFDQIDAERDESLKAYELFDGLASEVPASYRERLSDRLRLLWDEFREAESGENPSLASFIHFAKLWSYFGPIRYPFIVITPDGLFRAEWRESASEHFAITFLPNGDVRYVIFAPRPTPKGLGETDRTAGMTAFDRLSVVVEPFDIWRWVRS